MLFRSVSCFFRNFAENIIIEQTMSIVKIKDKSFKTSIPENLEEECKKYDKLIEAKGGIDLQVLGIGKNAHIGFNEPDIKFEATTHKVKLDEETIKANSRFFENEEDVPKYAISMGIKTIMLAKKIILLASGKNKAEAIYKAVYGSVRPDAPASILQLHQDVVVIVDKDAASLLPEKDKKVFVK